VLDAKELPVVGLFGRSPELAYENEFKLIDSMKVKQSAVFLQTKIGIINAIRSRINKISGKKFIIKKIDKIHSRIWRVADNAAIRFGGRIAGVSPAKLALDNPKSKSKFKHGGKREKGIYSKGKPRGTHANGQPIATPPVESEQPKTN
jgi:hypothetical protein